MTSYRSSQILLAALALSLALSMSLGGCRGDDATAGAGGPAASAPPSAAASTDVLPAPAAPPVRGVLGVGDGSDGHEVDPEAETDHEGACAVQGADVAPMQLLGFAWTSGISERNPKDKLRLTKPGDRVYLHLRLRNRSGRERCLRVQFRINGKKRPAITLKIGKSWSWRTWAYSTSRSDDRGHMEVLVSDDQGYEILNQKLPIAR